MARDIRRWWRGRRRRVTKRTMSTLLPYVLRAVASLTTADHAALSDAIATVAADEAPLFADDDAREKTAALMVAVAWRESNFKLNAVGDHGRSVCAFQILGGSPDLLTDAVACTRTAFRMMRHSFALCRESPLAIYARGVCASDEGRKLSRDRMALARWIRSKATETTS